MVQVTAATMKPQEAPTTLGEVVEEAVPTAVVRVTMIALVITISRRSKLVATEPKAKDRDKVRAKDTVEVLFSAPPRLYLLHLPLLGKIRMCEDGIRPLENRIETVLSFRR